MSCGKPPLFAVIKINGIANLKVYRDFLPKHFTFSSPIRERCVRAGKNGLINLQIPEHKLIIWDNSASRRKKRTFVFSHSSGQRAKANAIISYQIHKYGTGAKTRTNNTFVLQTRQNWFGKERGGGFSGADSGKKLGDVGRVWIK